MSVWSVTAVVVTWNAERDVDACLAALRAQDHPALDVVVVDNASTDATRAIVARHVAATRSGDVGNPVRLLQQDTNRGFAGAVNVGIAGSEADAVLLVNPDATLPPDHVALLVAALAADTGLGSVQGTLLRDGGPSAPVDSAGHVALRPRLFRNRGEGGTAAALPAGAVPPRGGPAVVAVAGVTGAAALHRRAMLDDVAVPGAAGTEWLDETLFAYYDDVDLDWRAALRGWRAAHVPSAVGHHRRGGAVARRSSLVEELNAANRLLLIAKLDAPGALARAAPAVVATTLLKFLWLVVVAPRAALCVPRRVRSGWAPTRRRRAHALARSVRSSTAVSHGFGRLDVRGWVATWWRRVRRGP